MMPLAPVRLLKCSHTDAEEVCTVRSIASGVLERAQDQLALHLGQRVPGNIRDGSSDGPA